jgi:hypothetical protein
MMPQCPKATTVALKHENAFARQTDATIAKTDGRGSFWPKIWLLLAETQEIAENRIEADKSAA